MQLSDRLRRKQRCKPRTEIARDAASAMLLQAIVPSHRDICGPSTGPSSSRPWTKHCRSGIWTDVSLGGV